MPSARDRLVLPLDVASIADARALIAELRDEVGVFKVGLELFTAEGPRAVEAVLESGARCFLDLKLHDIPATMAGAVRAAAGLGVHYLTVHASAGPEGLARSAEAAAGSGTQLLAVTVLTSVDEAQLSAMGIHESPGALVERYAALALASGVTGLVCSPNECRPLRARFGDAPVLMVPGVRPRGSDVGDQRRIATPAEAITAGASLLVVGRPIRSASDRVAAARAIVAEIEGARS
jgi:orotidine-5'-phosphate decarboxylase